MAENKTPELSGISPARVHFFTLLSCLSNVPGPLSSLMLKSSNQHQEVSTERLTARKNLDQAPTSSSANATQEKLPFETKKGILYW